jgi:hypothetical protein
MLNHLTIAVRDDASLRCPHPTSPELSISLCRPATEQATSRSRKCSTAAADIPTEVVFIDDSDGTPDVIRTVAQRAMATGAMAEPVRSHSSAGRALSERPAYQGPSSTSSPWPAQTGLVSWTHTLSIPPRTS